jgi:hypothetical protein
MKKIELNKSRILVKKITPPFLDWQENYAELLKFEESSLHHQWINSEIDFYFFRTPGDPDFFSNEAWIARAGFGPALEEDQEIFTHDLGAGTALRYEVPLEFWELNWDQLDKHYQKAQKLLEKSDFSAVIEATWRLKLMGGEKIVMDFFTDNGQ